MKSKGSKGKGTFKKGEQIKLHKKKPKRWEIENDEIEKLQTLYSSVKTSDLKTFEDIPLSSNTRKGLKDAKFKSPTDVQKEAIPLALNGSDILGAAKTGSGKTLAFIVPILESLYVKKWSAVDGLGALIITPTRELAYQIFEVLRVVGSHHEFSAGLIIGGKDLKFERKRMDKCNIIICTPGRLLQHMDENALLTCTNLQMLVLDEADRILDLGFQATMNSIIENLPTERQTLLFSATQTRSVKDLARLSLNNPMYVSVHEHSEYSTPKDLEQSYIVMELHDKINFLWSFIKKHKKSKVLVFMASCKQVKYIYEAFCRMQPGVSLLGLYGTLHQMRRMAVYDQFVRKNHAVLFSTDIAARGLDFPAVDWVIQMDCPEDAKTYIHRAGRTARYGKEGEALLVLLPSEKEVMVKELSKYKIPINEIRVNPKKLMEVQKGLENRCAKDVNLKESAKRAFVSYLKSVFLMKNKGIFDITKLNTDAYSASLGLAIPPRIRFLQNYLKQREIKTAKDTKKYFEAGSEKESELSEGDEKEGDKDESPSTENRLSTLNFGCQAEDSEDDLFTVKKIHFKDQDEDVPVVDDQRSQKVLTKAAVVKKLLKKNIKSNTKILFTEEGKAIQDTKKFQTTSLAEEDDNNEFGGIDISKSKKIMLEEDKIDKRLYQERVKKMHREKRLKQRKERLKEKEEKDADKCDLESSDDDDDENDDRLSFLPDPDKVYGPKSSGSDEDNEQEVESPEIEEEITNDSRKRKLSEKELSPEKHKKKKTVINEVMDTGLNIEEDEELALHLLTQS